MRSPSSRHRVAQASRRGTSVGTTDGLRRRWSLPVLIAVLTIPIVVLTGCTDKELERAQSELVVAGEDYVNAQEAMKASVSQARAVSDGTDPDEVADASVLDDLLALVAQAQVLVDQSTPAAHPEGREATQAEVGRVRDEVNSMLSMSTSLDDARTRVSQSIEEERAAAARRRLAPGDSHVITLADGNGNQQEVALSVGSWLPGNNPEDLQSAWEIAGGVGAMPLTSGTYSDGVLSGAFDGGPGSAFLFGTVTFRNMTPSFPSSGFGSSGVVFLYLSPRRFDEDLLYRNWADPSFARPAQCIQYGSGASCGFAGGGTPLAKPLLEGDQWGPVPFVMGFDNVFTPNDPRGNPQLGELTFFFDAGITATATGDTQFTVATSW